MISAFSAGFHSLMPETCRKPEERLDILPRRHLDVWYVRAENRNLARLCHLHYLAPLPPRTLTTKRRHPLILFLEGGKASISLDNDELFGPVKWLRNNNEQF